VTCPGKSSRDLSANVSTVRDGMEQTQKQISYTLAPCRNKSSPSRSCRSVSIVFGCKPSALPVAVLSGRSSSTLDLIPYRASVALIVTYQYHAKPKAADIYQVNLRKHQTRGSRAGNNHILNLRNIISYIVWPSVEACVNCHWSHDDRCEWRMAIRWSGIQSCIERRYL